MPQLRLSELYTSIQGEGPNVGTPTQFVRFAGCNLRCPAWPCDTPFAIHPSIWRHEADRLTGEELASRVSEWPRSLTLTGGEPFLQDAEELEAFARVAFVKDYRAIDIFTNGTFPFPKWAYNWCNVILDWKLGGSGEQLSDNAQRTRWENVVGLNPTDSIKFTVASQADLDEARVAWDMLQKSTAATFYVGAVWEAITDKEIINFVMGHQLPWKINVQVHKYIWPDAERGV